MTRRFLVTAALPYANNRLHLGHIAGAYLPADIYVRYLRLLEEDVVFICGSDDHGVPITITAQKEGTTPAEVVARYGALQRSAFGGLGIEFDIFSGTSTCPHHRELSQRFFRRIQERGDIAVRETDQWYCVDCARFLPDRYVEGTCPFCGAPDARGDQCDRCGRAFEQTELRDPRCATCGRRPELRRTRHWFFRLDEHRAALREWLERSEGWRENVRNYALGTLESPLPERSITRDLDWGVPVPLDDAAGKVLYVWFDAPVGYISFTRELFAARGEPEGWRAYWQDPATKVLHFIGKDNIIFHAVIWPAMLLGEGEFGLPSNVASNEYLNFRGEKLSKSRGTAVWLDDTLAAYGADRVRFYLVYIAPEGRDTSFTFEEFTARNNELLSDVLGNLCHRVFTFAERYLAGKTPAAPESSAARALLGEIAEARRRWGEALEALRFKEGLALVMSLARAGNRYFDAAEPWRTRKQEPARCAGDLRACLELIHALGLLLAPYLPETSRKLREALGYSGAPRRAHLDRLGEWCLTEGRELRGPGVLFPKLDDEALNRSPAPA